MKETGIKALGAFCALLFAALTLFVSANYVGILHVLPTVHHTAEPVIAQGAVHEAE